MNTPTAFLSPAASMAKFAPVGSSEEMQRWTDTGALLLAYSSDADVLYRGYSAAMRQIKGG